MGALSEKIAGIKDGSTKIVTVPEWDNTRIEVRSLTLAERNRITVASRQKKGGDVDVDRYYAAIIIATCFDPDSGEKAFDASDIRMLQSKSSSALDRLAKTAMRLSGLLDDEEQDETSDEEREQEFEDAVTTAGKGSSSTESFDSGS